MGKGKKKKKANAKLKRLKKLQLGKLVRFDLSNCSKKFSGFKNKYCYQTNIHNLIYKDAKFENVKFQSSNITNCNFTNTKLLGIDFISTNLKNTYFKNAILNDVIFFNCNLKNTDFTGVKFKNVLFISTNISVAKNLCMDDECKILNKYPNIDLDIQLEDIILKLSSFQKIYKYHVLHVKKNKINRWNVNILLGYYGDRLPKALDALYRRKHKYGFYTLYSYRQMIDSYLHI